VESKIEMTAPTRITRTIIDRDGAVTSVRTTEVTPSGIGLARSSADVDLTEIACADLEIAVKYLIKMIRDCDPSTRQMLKALHEEGRSTAAYARLGDVKNLSKKARIAFLSIWIECAHHIRREVADDIVLLDALRRLLPPYQGPALVLYRGETWREFSVQSYGMCWTSSRECAETFACALNAEYPDGGVLIETFAPTDAIISQAPTSGVCGWERQYVVDRRRLNEVRQLTKYPSAYPMPPDN
jgi:hypothetical protein